MAVSWSLALWLLLATAAIKLIPGFVVASLVICVCWAVVGPKQAIQALALSTLIGYVNPALITLPASSGPLLRLVLAVSALRVLPLTSRAEMSLLWPLWGFSAFAALTSSISSPAPSISMMKIVTFVLGSATSIVAFGRLPADQLRSLCRWFVTLIFVLMLLSALTVMRPSVAYHLNGTGLQGILSHPQALGTLLAPFVAWWLTGTLLERSAPRLLALIVVAAMSTIMLLTHARTALIATTLGFMVVVCTQLFGRPRAANAPRSRLAWICGCVAAGSLVISIWSGGLISSVEGFILKRTEDSNVSQAFLDSRGYSIISQWNSFLSRPLTGHGFGVYADGSFPSGVSMFNGIPISAPVEKGFVPTAVLEEDGLFGGLLFYFAMGWLARQVWRNDDPRWIAMFVAALGVNCGEAVILSPGGMGMLIWLIVSMTCSATRLNACHYPVVSPSPESSGFGEPDGTPQFNIMP